MKVAFAFLLVLCTLISHSSGNGKGAKLKEIDLKKKLQQKIFHHHQHHHHYHHHHPHHYHRHHHHHHHHHHHPHYHHDNKNKQHHHHHHRHHHHYHHPFKHHLHRHHHHQKKHFHNKHPLHQHHHSYKQQIHQHHHSNRRSDITHASVDLPNKLKLHVQIKDSQATKRQSLPDLLANLGEHLMKLGSSLTPNKSQVEARVASIDNADKGDIRNEVPEPTSSTVDSPTIQDSSMTATTINTDSQRKNVSLSEVEDLLHHALDTASGEPMTSVFSGNGEGEETDAATTNVITKTDEATVANRRNETFPQPELGAMESQEHDASEKRKESNYTLEEIAAQSFQTENTQPKDLSKDSRSNAEQEDKQSSHDDQWKNAESEANVSTDNVGNNVVAQHVEKIHENSTQTEALNLTLQALSGESKSADMNTTLEDEESQSDIEVSTPGSEEPRNRESPANDNKDEEEGDKNEVSGSGEEPSAETKDNSPGQTAADEKMTQEASGAGEPSNRPNQEEKESKSAQSTDQNEIKSTGGVQGREREGKHLIKESADSLDETNKPVPEGNIDQQTVVNVEGNQSMGNQSEDSFQSTSTGDTEPKKGSPVLEENRQIDQSDSNELEKPASLEGTKQSGASKDAKAAGDLDTQSAEPVFSEPERSKPATNLDKMFQSKNEPPNTQLDAKNGNQNQSNQQDRPAFNEVDDASGASIPSQESIRANAATQDQDSQTDLNGFTEGPKTPPILDDLAESSSPSGGEPQVVNVGDSQLSDLHEDVSQETGPEDAPDEIPVYTLSSPIGDDSFASDANNLPTPTSSVTTSSVNFIDSGVNMAPDYSDSSSLSEIYNTYSATDASSQGEYNSLSQSAGLQRDMLDDPVQESLETAVDSKSS